MEKQKNDERLAGALLAKASEFCDSSFPVLYCDEELDVVDWNAAAKRLGAKFRTANIRDYLTPDDARCLRALLNSLKVGAKGVTRYVTARAVKTREFTWLIAVARRHFDRNFAEIRLFRNRREMLAAFDSRELMFPVKPVVPEFAFTGDRLDKERIGKELDEVFEYNMLSHIYSLACSESEEPQAFDIPLTVRRIVAEAAKVFKFNKAKWKLDVAVNEPFSFPVISRRNFINVIALAVTLFSDISDKGQGEVYVSSEKDEVKIVFKTVAPKPSVAFVGDFIPPLIDKMYREAGSRASVLYFLCSLYGVGCYADVTFKWHVTLSFVFRKEGIHDAFNVKHRSVFDMKGMREAVALARMAGAK